MDDTPTDMDSAEAMQDSAVDDHRSAKRARVSPEAHLPREHDAAPEAPEDEPSIDSQKLLTPGSKSASLGPPHADITPGLRGRSMTPNGGISVSGDVSVGAPPLPAKRRLVERRGGATRPRVPAVRQLEPLPSDDTQTSGKRIRTEIRPPCSAPPSFGFRAISDVSVAGTQRDVQNCSGSLAPKSTASLGPERAEIRRKINDISMQRDGRSVSSTHGAQSGGASGRHVAPAVAQIPEFTMSNKAHNPRVQLHMDLVPKHSSSTASDRQGSSRSTSSHRRGDPRQKSPSGTLSSRGSSRPTTSGSSRGTNSSTAMSGDSAGFRICSITETRAREVGVAIVDISNMSVVELTQVSNKQSYSQIQMMLLTLQPAEILLNGGQRRSVMHRAIVERFNTDSCSVISVAPQYFSETRARAKLETLAVTPLSEDVTARYAVISAAGALLLYTEHAQSVSLAPSSLNFRWLDPRGHVAIDFSSLVQLEVICNARTGDQQASLFGCVNHTRTSVGARLLRSTLMSPPASMATITTRLDSVDELLDGASTTMYRILDLLPRFPDLDRLLALMVSTPKTSTPRTIRLVLETVIALKQTLDLCAPLAEILSSSTSPLLMKISESLASTTLQTMKGRLLELIDEDTKLAKTATERRAYEAFCVRPGIDGNLDAARALLTVTATEMEELGEQYRVRWKEPNLQIHHTASRGYHLKIPAKAGASTLPEECVQVVSRAKMVFCTTAELESRNRRHDEMLQNCYRFSNDVLYGLLHEIRGNMQQLFAVVEGVALLDLLVSFATLARTREGYVRPNLVDSRGAMVIKQGRHPTKDILVKEGKFVPNDILLDSSTNMLVITGPNGSGKSTYLKQTALLTVLAHAGCYVPASAATIPICDRLFTRIGTSDSIEDNASSFLLEMRETAFLLEHVSSASLVLLDELGRGTGTDDGVGVAWSVAEHLQATGCRVLTVTHYPQLQELSVIYPNVRNVHLAVSLIGDGAGIDFTFTVKDGGAPESGADGIAMAKVCGFPVQVVDHARRIRLLIDRALGAKRSATATRTREYQGFMRRLCALSTSTLEPGPLKVVMRSMVADYRTALAAVNDPTELDPLAQVARRAGSDTASHAGSPVPVDTKQPKPSSARAHDEGSVGAGEGEPAPHDSQSTTRSAAVSSNGQSDEVIVGRQVAPAETESKTATPRHSSTSGMRFQVVGPVHGSSVAPTSGGAAAPPGTPPNSAVRGIGHDQALSTVDAPSTPVSPTQRSGSGGSSWAVTLKQYAAATLGARRSDSP